MHKKYILIFFLFISFYSFSNTIILKKNISTDNPKCTLQDISINKLSSNISNIVIAYSTEKSRTITSDEILKLLFSYSVYNIDLIGDSTIINFNQKTPNNNYQINKKVIHKNNPLESLEEYFESFLGDNIFTIKIDSVKTEPSLNIKIIKSNYRWKLNKSYYSLNEIKKIKKLTLVFDEKNFLINLT